MNSDTDTEDENDPPPSQKRKQEESIAKTPYEYYGFPTIEKWDASILENSLDEFKKNKPMPEYKNLLNDDGQTLSKQGIIAEFNKSASYFVKALASKEALLLEYESVAPVKKKRGKRPAASWGSCPTYIFVEEAATIQPSAKKPKKSAAEFTSIVAVKKKISLIGDELQTNLKSYSNDKLKYAMNLDFFANHRKTNVVKMGTAFDTLFKSSQIPITSTCYLINEDLTTRGLVIDTIEYLYNMLTAPKQSNKLKGELEQFQARLSELDTSNDDDGVDALIAKQARELEALMNNKKVKQELSAKVTDTAGASQVFDPDDY